MRSGGDAMRDVEIVEVEVPDGPGRADLDLGATSAGRRADGDDPEVDADELARRRRVARARRVLRRTWPVAVLVVVALVGTRMVSDAREDSRVAARQQVDGVLRDVRPDLTPRTLTDGDPAIYGTLAIQAGDLSVQAPTTFRPTAPRVLRAVDPAGDRVWTTSLEDPATPDGSVAFSYPSCVPADEPATRVLCLVVDEEGNVLSNGVDPSDVSWETTGTVATRLVTLDAATGQVLGRRALEPLSGMTTDGGVLYLASIASDGTTTVTAEDAVSGAEHWRTEIPNDVEIPAFSPSGVSVASERGHLLVASDAGSWALDPTDGRIEFLGAAWSLSVTRTGLLASTSGPTELVDSEGEVRVADAGDPVMLAVDDGSVPDLELTARHGSSTGTVLRGVDSGTGEVVWENGRGSGAADSPLILLDDVLYGSDAEEVWAVDATTGLDLWSTPRAGSTEYGGYTVLTDGRHLLVVLPAEGTATAGSGAGDGASGSGQMLLALRLSDGAEDWRVPLPGAAGPVWAVEGNLIVMSEDTSELMVLNQADR